VPPSSPPSSRVTAPPAAAKPVHAVQPVPRSFPRYAYLSLGKPQSGDRRAAERAFAEARNFEQEHRLESAMQSYRDAARLDPSWFEAQFNFGVLAYRLHHDRLALAADQMALAVRPDSTDARYNFALALTAAGYPIDAAHELEKILAADPDEARAQLALGNLYAQQLNEPARARAHYLKVLALDPNNPQAAAIRFWLSANPP
jgi:tetratricopeptide (TPR) repeat protein